MKFSDLTKFEQDFLNENATKIKLLRAAGMNELADELHKLVQKQLDEWFK